MPTGRLLPVLFMFSLGSPSGCEETPQPILPSALVPAASATGAHPSAPASNANPTTLTADQLARDKALEPTATAIVDAYPNVGNPLFSSLVAQLSHDKTRFLYSSLRDGQPEIYVADVSKPGEAPTSITRGPERAIWASYTRDERYILFTRDEGADENWRIWRTGLDGSSPVLLTPGPKMHRDEPILPLRRPGSMFYTTHVSTSPVSQLVVQSIAGGDPRVVYEDPAPASAADVTADGSRALFVRWNSASDLVVFEVETSGGRKPVRLYPPEGTKAAVTWVLYSADERSVLIATDEGKETFALLALDPSTKTVKARYAVSDPSTAQISGFQVSPKGDRIGLAIDAGNRNELRILDARKLTFLGKVATPLGFGGVGPFTDDGKSFTFWMSTPDRPAEPFIADAATGEGKPLRADARPTLDSLPPLTVSIEKVQAFDGLTLPINLYLPKTDPGKRLPTLVVFHGGPSSSYAVRWSAFTRFFTAQGFAVAEPNIRGSTGFGRAYEMADNREKRGDVLKDVVTVNGWVKSQPWCDLERVVVFGGSYGGYVTLMAVTRQPTLWRAGVDLFGIANLKTFLQSTDQIIRSAFVDEFGDLDKDADLLEQFSPSRDYDKVVSPLFVYAGANDPRVPRSESDQIVMALRGRGVPVEYMVAANEGHSVDRRENKIELMTRVVRFLRDALN